MLLSTLTEQLTIRFGFKRAVEMIHEAGFDAYDASLMGQAFREFEGEDYADFARSMREYADALGIVCNQAHAPFGTSTGNPVRDEEIFRSVVRAMEVASILGAKCIVVHPNQHMLCIEHTEEIRAINLAFYRRLLPYCEQFGIKVAVENMWDCLPGSRKIIESACARPEEFCDYVDMLESPWIVACLDIGHVPLVGGSLKNMIHALGPRLQALHVHDNDYLSDMHTLPYTQKIPFDDVTTALAEIGYEGDFTYEADEFWLHFPNELVPDVLVFMEKVGRHLAGEIERKKKEMSR
ncbi:MAG: sugar phosphate isomerase/epimerase [Oscillospiraceae bacterium]|nr:sugar phosphate isomerase/epimerase [Oscillospiraceae bacterium]